jgi:hypothetical protein
LALFLACGSDYSSSSVDSPDAADATTASSDASTDRAAPSADASADAGADACAHTLCETFDNGTLTQWSTFQSGNVTLGLTDASASGPYAIVVDVPLGDAGSQKRFAYLSHAFTGAGATSTAVELDLRAVADDSSQSINIEELVLTPTASDVAYYTVGFAQQQTTANEFEYKQFPDGGSKEVDTTFNPLPADAWTHVRIAFDLQDGGAFTVSENGIVVATHALTSPDFSEMELRIGVTYVNEPAGPFRLLIDNVTFDRAP